MNLEEKLLAGAKALGVDLGEDAARKMLEFMDLLLEWNKKINLTAVEEPEDIIIKHFLDSLTLLGTGLIGHHARLIDVGAGAGFPSIPLKLARPDIRLTMLDSLGKRVKFLEEACAYLGINGAECVHGRAEDFGRMPGYREKFDIVASRAVAGLNTLCEYCLPFAAVEGHFLAMKGPGGEDELKGALNAVFLLGGRPAGVEQFNLPFSDITHTVVVIKKIKKCPTNFPRKAGKPSKEPIF